MSPGVVTQFELSGGNDVDVAFPSEGQAWYEKCPEGGCGDPCEEGDVPNSLCYVFIKNQNRAYRSSVTGYIDAYQSFGKVPDDNLDDKFLSKHVYFGVDARYPIPADTDAVVNISTIRDGAVYDEIIGTNEATFENSYPVTLSPTRYIVRYAANTEVFPEGDNSFEEVLKDASFIARERLSDDVNPSLNDVLGRLEDERDMHLNVHFEVERVPLPDLPVGIYGCSDTAPDNPNDCDRCIGFRDYVNLREYLKSIGVHVLIVKDLHGCNNLVDGDTLPQDPCLDCDVAWGWGYYPPSNRPEIPAGNFMVISTASDNWARTFLHELGHNCGLDHVDDTVVFNIMNVSRNGSDRGDDIASNQVNNYQSGIYYLANQQ